MSESGHSQPTFASSFNRKKKKFRGQDQDGQAIGDFRTHSSISAKDVNEDFNKGSPSLSQTNTKTPVILAKPGKAGSESGNKIVSTNAVSTSWQEVATSPSAPIAPKLSMTFSRSPQTAGSEKKFQRPLNEAKYRSAASPNLIKQSLSQVSSAQSSSSPTNTSAKPKDTALPPNFSRMLDSSLHWLEGGIDLLQDQSDFMVIGVIGKQSVGKSTILSVIAGNHFDDPAKSFIFKQQTPEVKERASHMTSGIDMAITNERLILLDTQPILSPSLLEQSIHYDRKSTVDYSGSSNIEIQSLQMAAFLLTVCHVIIVVQDWFTDNYIYKFLQTAEMLKPVTTPPSHDSSSASISDPTDIQPVIVFVHNKMDAEMFNIRTLSCMNEIMSNMIKFCSVHCKGHFSMVETNLYPGLSRLCPAATEVNAFLMPNINDTENAEEKCDVSKVTNDPADQQFLSLPEYVGRPSTSLLENTFRKMILSLQRHQLTHLPLTEKNWFHFAARTWETIRKSQLVSEYNRLLAG